MTTVALVPAGSAHIARATLESIAFQCAELAIAMREDAGVLIAELRVDGGAAVNNFLMQFQADLLGIKVVRPKITETTALGAAYLAGLAVGFWKTPEEIASLWATDRVFVPNLSADTNGTRIAAWRHAVERTKNWG